VLIHLDTDLGGDPDDACALAMLLGWGGVELAGVTTTIDPGGKRAACVRYLLNLTGRDDVEVTAGAAVSSTTRRPVGPAVDDPRFWPAGLNPCPAPAGAFLYALEEAARRGATIVSIGPVTNLAAWETLRPGALKGVRVVAMGGWLHRPPAGYPAWGPERDWNFFWDTAAAATLLASGADLTLVPISTTVQVPLRAVELPGLRRLGPLGNLLADQSEAWAADRGYPELAAAHTGLPDDTVNLHHDPLTAAVGAGWDGAAGRRVTVRAATDDSGVTLVEDARGRPVEVIDSVDTGRFTTTWLSAVAAAAGASGISSRGGSEK
jgi:purine nucleosidase